MPRLEAVSISSTSSAVPAVIVRQDSHSVAGLPVSYGGAVDGLGGRGYSIPVNSRKIAIQQKIKRKKIKGIC